jgi:hypothetical protein
LYFEDHEYSLTYSHSKLSKAGENSTIFYYIIVASAATFVSTVYTAPFVSAVVVAGVEVGVVAAVVAVVVTGAEVEAAVVVVAASVVYNILFLTRPVPFFYTKQ